jgi:AraC-like DNA-binding protein
VPTGYHFGPMAIDLPGSYMREVVELAARWHVRPEELLRGLPVKLATLSDPGTRVPLAVCAEIVRRAHALTGEPALALYLGWQVRLSSHGFLGFAAMTADTLADAGALAVRFAATRTAALGLALYTEGTTASLVIEERAELGALRELAVISLMIVLWQAGQALTGKPLAGTAECAFPAPDYIAKVPFAASIITFDRPVHRLVFDRALLALPVKTADPVAMQLARTQCERELAAIADAGLVGRVRAALGDGTLDLPQIARQLRMSTRTLKRRLAERGTSFREIVDDIRRQRALLLVADRGLSIDEIAGRLGYTETPNFTRAFRRWTGATPSAYRAR